MDQYVYLIDDCKFDFNSALETYGGGLVLINAEWMAIYNSTFTNNSAITLGGALYENCNADGDFNCRTDIEGCYFEDNYAGIAGGGLYWRDVEPIWGNNSWDANSAKFYGPDIGCFSQRIVLITQEEYEEQVEVAS